MRLRPVHAIAAAVLLALIPSAAYAHHPDIDGSQTCDGLVTFTATAWNDDEEATPENRTNHHIVVKLLEAEDHSPVTDEKGDPVEFHDEFTPDNNFTFSGQYQLDEPRDVILVAIAEADWGPTGEFGEKDSTRDLWVPVGCDRTATDTITPPGSVVSAETVTADPGQSAAADPGQAAAEGGEALPFTGSTTGPLLAAGLALIAAGALILRVGRRRGVQRG